MGTSKNKPSFEFCAEECGVLKILPLGMHLRIEQPVWQFSVFRLCCLPWLFVCSVVKRIEVKMGENTKNRAIDSWKTQCRWLNCTQIVLGVKNAEIECISACCDALPLPTDQ